MVNRLVFLEILEGNRTLLRENSEKSFYKYIFKSLKSEFSKIDIQLINKYVTN